MSAVAHLLRLAVVVVTLVWVWLGEYSPMRVTLGSFVAVAAIAPVVRVRRLQVWAGLTFLSLAALSGVGWAAQRPDGYWTSGWDFAALLLCSIFVVSLAVTQSENTVRLRVRVSTALRWCLGACLLVFVMTSGLGGTGIKTSLASLSWSLILGAVAGHLRWRGQR